MVVCVSCNMNHVTPIQPTPTGDVANFQNMVVGNTFADTFTVLFNPFYNQWYSSNVTLDSAFDSNFRYHEIHYWHFYSVDSLAYIEQKIPAPVSPSYFFSHPNTVKKSWSISSNGADMTLYIGTTPTLYISQLDSNKYKASEVGATNHSYRFVARKIKEFYLVNP